jgi:hypothetical protein
LDTVLETGTTPIPYFAKVSRPTSPNSAFVVNLLLRVI